MVKLRGPAVSTDAAGALAKTVVFSQNKGRRYLKKLTRPKQPKSAGQLGQRALTNFLSSFWGDLSSGEQATWNALAAELDLPPYQAYLKFNLQRWTTFATPTYTYPPNPASNPATTPTLTPVARLRTILLTPGAATWNFNWGVLIHHSTTPGFSPTKANAIAATVANFVRQDTYVHGPLPAGTHYYRATPFAAYGKRGAPGAQESAVIP